MEDLITLEHALEFFNDYKGWFYLKEKPWTLDTKGFFRQTDLSLSPEEEQSVVDRILKDGWKPIVTVTDIEDVIDNLEDQVSTNATMQQKLDALEFFYDNDAFGDLN